MISQLDEGIEGGGYVNNVNLEGIGMWNTLMEREQKRPEKKEMAMDCTAEECRDRNTSREAESRLGNKRENEM